MKFAKYFAAGLISVMGLASCGDDFMDVEYTSNLDKETAVGVAADKPSVFMNAIWSQMVAVQSSHDDFGLMSILHASDMMGEDIAMGADSWFVFDYDFDNREYNYRRTRSTWTILYSMISMANDIIKLYPDYTSETGNALVGQALSVRACAYYYLALIYQNPFNADGSIASEKPAVPLMLTASDVKSDGSHYTEEELENLKGRNTIGLIMSQIEQDLRGAVENLEESGYTRESSDKNSIDYQVASGLLARYYLISSKWNEAAQAANKARAGYSMGTAKKGSLITVSDADWMWGFNHDTETQTTYASFYSHISNEAPGYSGIQYNTNLIDARLYSMIPADDTRRAWFNGPEGDATASQPGGKMPYAARKFGHEKDWSEDYMYMRAPEMVLIEAEAYARMGQEAKAAEVLSVLMNSRQPSWSKLHSTASVEDVLLQRRIELWGEGFVRFDLIRNNKGVDRKYEGSNHLPGHLIQVPAQDKRWVYQIPMSEMQENSHISEDEQNE